MSGVFGEFGELAPPRVEVGLGSTIRGAEIAAELEDIMKVAMSEAINEILVEIYEMSQKEVPRSEDERAIERFGKTLAESGIIIKSTPETLVGTVEYDQPSAAAQHEGAMLYERDGKTIEWIVHQYTTEGTKSHYLSDPMKAMIPQIEIRASAKVEAMLAARFPST
jgi:hypothetical protein